MEGIDKISGFGEYSSADGYGGGYHKIVDCNSALGLLGLMGFIELLRDVLANIVRNGKRKRRSLNVNFFPEDPLFPEFAITLEELSQIFIPLLKILSDVNDDRLPESCLQKSLCEANRAIVHGLGQGRWFSESIASLMSDVAAKSFTDRRLPLYEAARSAGAAGRRGEACVKLFPNCTTTS